MKLCGSMPWGRTWARFFLGFSCAFIAVVLASCAPARLSLLAPTGEPTLAAVIYAPLIEAAPSRTALPGVDVLSTHQPSPTETAEATETPTIEPTGTSEPTPALLTGAGDIAACGTRGAQQTAALLEQFTGDIFTAGDNSNGDGTLQEYQDCFGPTWGRFLDRIHPAAGNHDYETPGAASYFQYFGAAAGEPGKGYYSFEEGAWHVIVLNSNCSAVGCDDNSPQVQWLIQDLAAHPALCTLAIWHHPRFSSGLSGSSGMYPFWKALYAAGADVVINGNDHDYERFAPQDPLGNADPLHGIREFVVGTGGAGQRVFNAILPNSEAHHTGTFGVLRLALYADHYDWSFLPVAGGDFQD
ncbi:MAG TPA: metallophosphoesterase, partial [Anaerolineaceae bacterium]